MPVKKRIRYNDSKSPTNLSKKKRTKGNETETVEVQGLWRTLNQISTINDNSTKEIKNSLLFVPFLPSFEVKSIISCVKALHEYIDAAKVYVSHNTKAVFVVLRNFSIIDCCLALTVLFAFKNRNWITSSSSNYFLISKNIDLRGSFFLGEHAVLLKDQISQQNKSIANTIQKSQYLTLRGFDEYHISEGKSMSAFMNSINNFFLGSKFSKKQDYIKLFSRSYIKFQNSLNVDFTELVLDSTVLYDVDQVILKNKPLIEESQRSMVNYAEELIDYCNGLSSIKYEGVINITPSSTNDTDLNRKGSSFSNAPNKDQIINNFNQGTNRPNFMTQEQIKEHCIATVKAGIDSIKMKSPYQIMKVYVKCPKQNYIDLIFQNLNDLRLKSNCNIVVLHLNNLHESQGWFDGLDISKHTTITQTPHPSTVRIVSIGGVGEHILKAFQMISDILNT